jgi:hypothetical protein
MDAAGPCKETPMELLIHNNPRLSVTESIVPPVWITWDDIALIMRSKTGVETDAIAREASNEK